METLKDVYKALEYAVEQADYGDGVTEGFTSPEGEADDPELAEDIGRDFWSIYENLDYVDIVDQITSEGSHDVSTVVILEVGEVTVCMYRNNAFTVIDVYNVGESAPMDAAEWLMSWNEPPGEFMEYLGITENETW